MKRGNSEGSLPSSARREKDPGFDLEKKIVEEAMIRKMDWQDSTSRVGSDFGCPKVNRVLESRLAAKEDSDALKKELEKAGRCHRRAPVALALGSITISLLASESIAPEVAMLLGYAAVPYRGILAQPQHRWPGPAPTFVRPWTTGRSKLSRPGQSHPQLRISCML